MATKKKMPTANGVGVSDIRNARNLASHIITIRTNKSALEDRMEIEAQEGTDPVPGSEPKRDGGQIILEDGRPIFPSYNERFADFEAAEARAWKIADRKRVRRLVEASIRAMEAEEAVQEEELLAS